MTSFVDWDKIPPEQIISIISKGMGLLMGAYKSMKKLFGKKKADKMLSSVFRELLKKNPDIDSIRAQLKLFQAGDVEGELNSQRARSMLAKVEAHHGEATMIRLPQTGKMVKKADKIGMMATKVGRGKAIRKPIEHKDYRREFVTMEKPKSRTIEKRRGKKKSN